MSKTRLYWFCQIGGWLFFVLINAIFIKLSNAFSWREGFSLFLLFIFGLTFTHLYRGLIVYLNWIKISPIKLIPRVISVTLLLATIIYFIHYFIEALLGISSISFDNFDFVVATQSILNIEFLLFFWSLIYFLIHYIQNYKKAEIENLKWQASINEIELNKLKSQLNPHFIFNAMNSIRALVEENPARAKESITQLSNILRNTLTMGRNKVIPFDDELKIVKDYVALETTRYEERLHAQFIIDPLSVNFSIPPLMLQTLVENGIKHGISKLPEGGELIFQTTVKNKLLHITIKNSGQLDDKVKTVTGFGIKNTEQRLALLYGVEASFTIINYDTKNVKTELTIPQQTLK